MAIPKIIDIGLITGVPSGTYTGGGTNYLVETPTGILYRIYIDSNIDPVFAKSIDYGYTWSVPTQLKLITCTQIAVWYDRWTDPTGTLGDLIHVVYTDSGADDVFYRSIDTANADTLGTETTVFAGGSTANGGALSITRMRGGNILVCGCIDAGTELFAKKSIDAGANWSDIAAVYEATPDKLILVPGWATDTNDSMCFYYDNSATEVSVKYFDDSANSWSEASIATSIVHPDHTTTTLGHWSATVDHANSQNLIAFWTAVDTANADLRVFKVSQSAQTETAANVVLNSTDDQGFCSISIKGNDWYVLYLGSSDGAEIYSSRLTNYYKKSTDNGATWGSETVFSNLILSCLHFWGCPIIYKTMFCAKYIDASAYIFTKDHAVPHSIYQLGM